METPTTFEYAALCIYLAAREPENNEPNVHFVQIAGQRLARIDCDWRLEQSY